MTIVTELILWYLVGTLIEILTWGALGYLVFRIFGVSEGKWYFDYFIVATLYTLLDLWSGSIISRMDLSIGNEEVMAWFDGDIEHLFTTSPFDILINFVVILAGYFIGRLLWRRFMQKQ